MSDSPAATLLSKYQEALDSYQLLLQFSTQDLGETSFSDQIKLIVFKWPDVVQSAIATILGDSGSYDKLLEDLDFVIVEPIKAFYEALSEKAKSHGFISNFVVMPNQDAVVMKKAYIKDINDLFDILEAVTKKEYPRIEAE